MPQNQVQEKWYRQWFDENYLLLYQNRGEQDAVRQIELILKTLDDLTSRVAKNNVDVNIAFEKLRHLENPKKK